MAAVISAIGLHIIYWFTETCSWSFAHRESPITVVYHSVCFIFCKSSTWVGFQAIWAAPRSTLLLEWLSSWQRPDIISWAFRPCYFTDPSDDLCNDENLHTRWNSWWTVPGIWSTSRSFGSVHPMSCSRIDDWCTESKQHQALQIPGSVDDGAKWPRTMEINKTHRSEINAA